MGEVRLFIARACAIVLIASAGAPVSASGGRFASAVSALGSADAAQRQRAELELVKGGASAVPDLVAELAAGRRVSRMRVLVANIGSDAIPPLVELAESADADTAAAARSLLGQIVWRGAGAHVDLLIGCLKRAGARAACGLALVRAVNAKAAGKVGALRELLGSDEADLRMYGALALAQVGPKAQDAAPDLAAALSDAEARVRGSAAAALGKMGRKAAQFRPALEAARNDADSDVRLAVEDALRQMK